MPRQKEDKRGGSPFNFQAAKDNNLIGKKLSETRKSRKLTLDDVSELLKTRGIDIGKGAVSKWELGQNVPSGYQLAALCDIFDIADPVLFFTGRQLLNDEGLRKVSEYKKDLINTGCYAPEPVITEVIYINMPVQLMAASAGTGNFLDGDNFEMVSFPENSVPAGADFGIRVSGDSMEPVYQNGQIVWVKQCSSLCPGEVGIFTYDGDGYIKMYSERVPEDVERFTDSQGITHMQPVLISYNKKYQPIIVTADKAFQIVGKVL